MSISAIAGTGEDPTSCTSCAGRKGAPIATIVHFGATDLTNKPITVVLCEECGRDAANAIGFMCVKDGGWSKIEARKRKPARP